MLVAIIVAIIIIINKWKSIKDKKNNCSFLTFHYTIPTETIIPTIFIDNKPKVYCKDCKWYNDMFIDCDAPQNTTDNWEKPNGERINIPHTINKDNNCSWYEPSVDPEKFLKTIFNVKENKKGVKDVKDNKKRNNKN